MNKYTSLILLLTSLATLVAAGQKHVLFIGVDDLRPELGCYGVDYMKTPHIDQLAKDGLLFERAYCQQAVCGPSRISILTGLRPDSTKVYSLDQSLDKELPDTLTMPQFYQQNGYRTISLGKIYHHSKDDKDYWDLLDSCEAPKYANPATVKLVTKLAKEGKTKGLKGKELRHYSHGPAYESADVPDNTYSDGIIADRAIEQIKNRPKDKPLFLAVGFKKPHLTFVAPKKYWDLYNPNDIEIPKPEAPKQASQYATTSWGELRNYRGIPAKEDIPDDLTRTLIHGYRACVSYIDAQVGRVLAELDRQGMSDETLIVLWGDHGWKLGEYGDWCKHTNFELDTHVPLIYSGPGIPKGKRSRALVEYIDMFPTLAESCGLDVPKTDGLSSAPLFENPNLNWKEAAFSQYPRGRIMGYSIRSGQWRYTEWRQKDGKVVDRELYDHAQTKSPTANLAALPDHSQTIKELAAILNKGVKIEPPLSNVVQDVTMRIHSDAKAIAEAKPAKTKKQIKLSAAAEKAYMAHFRYQLNSQPQLTKGTKIRAQFEITCSETTKVSCKLITKVGDKLISTKTKSFPVSPKKSTHTYEVLWPLTKEESSQAPAFTIQVGNQKGIYTLTELNLVIGD